MDAAGRSVSVRYEGGSHSCPSAWSAILVRVWRQRTAGSVCTVSTPYSKYGMLRGTALAFDYIDVTAAPVHPPEHLGRSDCQP